MPNELLLRFYRGEGTDDVGRRIGEIWSYSRDELEVVHDYIQWLFPLEERSAFNPGAPLLDAATIAEFRRDASLRENVQRSLELMLGFYGFRTAGEHIVRAPDFAERSRVWLSPGNHNFLRLTRILKSLSLLGHDASAESLLECLEELYRERPSVIGSNTVGFWRRATS